MTKNGKDALDKQVDEIDHGNHRRITVPNLEEGG